MKRLVRISPLLLVLLGLTGCQQNNLHTENPFPIGRSQYDAMFQAALTTLRHRGFAIDRKDYRFGVITTRPRVSPTILEPWKHENASASLAFDSTMNELARKITVKLLPDTSSATQPMDKSDSTQPAATQPPTLPWTGDYKLRVTVALWQRDYPTRRLIGSSGANVFNSLSAVPAEWAARGIPAAYWQPVGRDKTMEEQLLHQIIHKAYWPNDEN